jgi:hypothetical protein
MLGNLIAQTADPRRAELDVLGGRLHSTTALSMPGLAGMQVIVRL